MVRSDDGGSRRRGRSARGRGCSVTRAKIVVRPLAEADTTALAPLWADLERSYDPGPVPGGPALLQRARAHWESGDAADDRRTVVAFDGDEVVGMAAFSVVELGPWSGTVVLVSLLHVRDGARRRGVGHALLVEALAFADRIGADQVAVDVPPHLRDANRYFARLGFGPVVTRRVATTSALRRRLLPETPARGRLAGLRARARRSARDVSHAATPEDVPLDPTPAPPQAPVPSVADAPVAVRVGSPRRVAVDG